MTSAPRIIDSALVKAFAVCDSSVEYTGKTSTFYDGKPVGKVPCLAICANLKEPDVLLFYCDEQWETIGARGFESVEAAKQRAEIEYRGISSKWNNTNYMREDLKPEDLEPKCSFCGAPYFDVEGLIEGDGVFFCYKCVKTVASGLSDGGDEA